MEIRDRIDEEESVPMVSRFNPIPMPYILSIREQFNDDGTVKVLRRRRLYSDGTFVDEKLEGEENG